MISKLLVATILAAGATFSAAGGVQAAGFICPYKEARKAPKDLPPIKGLEEDMDQVEAHSQLATLVAGLATAKIPPALIVDHLVWAYCPLVANDAKLSDAEKFERLRRFARQVAGLVYAAPGATELDILVDLPLAPDLLNEVDEAARAGDISRDEWIRQVIEKALDNP